MWEELDKTEQKEPPHHTDVSLLSPSKVQPRVEQGQRKERTAAACHRRSQSKQCQTANSMWQRVINVFTARDLRAIACHLQGRQGRGGAEPCCEVLQCTELRTRCLSLQITLTTMDGPFSSEVRSQTSAGASPYTGCIVSVCFVRTVKGTVLVAMSYPYYFATGCARRFCDSRNS